MSEYINKQKIKNHDLRLSLTSMSFLTSPMPWVGTPAPGVPTPAPGVPTLNLPRLPTCNITHFRVRGIGQCLFQFGLQSDLLLYRNLSLGLNIGFP